MRFHRFPRLSAIGATLAAILAACLAGCGGGSSGGGGGGGGGGGTTPDMGTLTFVSDNDQYSIANASSGLFLGIQGQSQVAGTNVAQASADSQNDQLWHFMPMNYSAEQFNVENLLTHQVLGIANASTSTGAQALQWADNGTNDHLWEFFKLTDGNYLIENVNSSLYLTDANSGTTSSAAIDQEARATTGTGCTCQEWTLTSTNVSPYAAPLPVSGTGIYVHDPYMLKDSAGTYWLYGTHQTLAYSTDMSTFTYTTAASAQGACTAAEGTAWLTDASHCPIVGPDFASWSGLQTPPSDNNGQNIDMWAPSLLQANGTYYLYYAIPWEPSTGAEAVIGRATSSTPYGPWVDKGYVVSSWTAATTAPPTSTVWNFSASTTWNAIDPAPFVDASGNWWSSFGSFQDGIHIIQLDPATGMPAAGNPSPYPIIAARGAGEEGSFIYPWVVSGTQYYFYFASINVCCSAESPYRIITGRSQSPNGPFVDRGGLDLASGGGTILLSSHSNIVGPGGESVFTDMVSGVSTPTLVYHYYDGNNGGTPTLGINRLAFTSDGWPYVQ
ncbi:MAG TPA: RICIN domain-containing protein [Acidobacteriaceae bacterium]|jgi:arabinan endo-1,5-alpha-L-arabinosidase|nr:RICIN domain-containing protein [Acidobacteriaceae bacterium]